MTDKYRTLYGKGILCIQLLHLSRSSDYNSGAIILQFTTMKLIRGIFFLSTDEDISSCSSWVTDSFFKQMPTCSDADQVFCSVFWMPKYLTYAMQAICFTFGTLSNTLILMQAMSSNFGMLSNILIQCKLPR